MKRVFFLFSTLLVLASCDNAGSAEEQVKDSLDSIKNLKVESVQEAADDAIDTIQKNADSLKARVDSIGEQTRDSVNKNK